MARRDHSSARKWWSDQCRRSHSLWNRVSEFRYGRWLNFAFYSTVVALEIPGASTCKWGCALAGHGHDAGLSEVAIQNLVRMHFFATRARSQYLYIHLEDADCFFCRTEPILHGQRQMLETHYWKRKTFQQTTLPTWVRSTSFTYPEQQPGACDHPHLMPHLARCPPVPDLTQPLPSAGQFLNFPTFFYARIRLPCHRLELSWKLWQRFCLMKRYNPNNDQCLGNIPISSTTQSWHLSARPQVQAELFPQYGFTALPADRIQVARDNIEKLRLASGAKEWIVEDSTVPLVGQGQNVLSSKRKSWVEAEVRKPRLQGCAILPPGATGSPAANVLSARDETSRPQPNGPE